MTVGKWASIDITTPSAFYRHKAWRWNDGCWIVAIAFAPTMFTFGGELLTGYGKGAALYIGPFWLGVAANMSAPTRTPTKSKDIDDVG